MCIQDVSKFIHLKPLCSHLHYYSNVLGCMSSYPFNTHFYFSNIFQHLASHLMYRYFNFINSFSFQLVKHCYFIYTWPPSSSHISIIILASQQNKLHYLYCVLPPFPMCRSQLFMELVRGTFFLQTFSQLYFIGCVLIFEYLFFLLQSNKDESHILKLAINTYQQSGIQATVVNSLQNAIQQHGDDYDILFKVIIDIVLNNQMCMLSLSYILHHIECTPAQRFLVPLSG